VQNSAQVMPLESEQITLLGASDFPRDDKIIFVEIGSVSVKEYDGQTPVP
jgi:hypothetical protein